MMLNGLCWNLASILSKLQIEISWISALSLSLMESRRDYPMESKTKVDYGSVSATEFWGRFYISQLLNIDFFVEISRVIVLFPLSWAVLLVRYIIIARPFSFWLII